MKPWLFKNKLVLLSLFLITLLAYGQTLGMYFWIDDNALIYRLEHPSSTEGFWGKGLIGSGPYRHIVDQFVPFYPLFKINPLPYYAIGIILYFLASVSVYLFLDKLTKNKKLAFAAAAIFASGYVGSETIFGITNSWQTSRGVAISLLSLYSFIRYLQFNRRRWYFLSVISFFFALDTVFIRAPGLILAFIVAGILFSPFTKNLTSFINFIIRLIPFAIIHYFIYISNSALAERFGILELVKVIIEQKKYYLIPIPFEDLGNIFIPNVLTDQLDKLNIWFFHTHNSLYYFSSGEFLAGIFIIILTIITFILFYKREKLLSKLLILSLGWVVANFIVFYLRDPYYTLSTVHRYFTYSLVGVGVYWSILFYLISKYFQKKYLFNLFAIIVIGYLILGFGYEKNFNQDRSTPIKAFFSDVNDYLPTIQANSLLYFDLENTNLIKNRFSTYFGGMLPEEANFAIYNPKIVYPSIKITNDFSEVLARLKSGKNKLSDLNTFYYGSTGLLDTTSQVREILQNGKILAVLPQSLVSTTKADLNDQEFSTQTLISQDQQIWTGMNPEITINLPKDTPIFVPARLTFSLKAEVINPNLPYKTKGSDDFGSSSQINMDIFNYLLSANQFRKDTVVSTGSVWMDELPPNIIDGSDTTFWRGNRIYWDDIVHGATQNREFVSLDFQKPMSISGLRWVTAQKPLVPTDYSIYTSLDGTNWQLAKHVVRFETFPEGSTVRDTFPPVQTRFIKMYIDKTFGNDGPEIAEIEPIQTEYQSLDPDQITKVVANPFGSIQSPSELLSASSYIIQQAFLNVAWQTDADKSRDGTKSKKLQLNLDGQYHNYQIVIPANGINLITIDLNEINFPSALSIKDIQLVYDPL